MLDLVVAVIALVVASISLARAWVPPQTRKVLELQGRIEDLEFHADETARRMTKRARSEGAETARAAHVKKSADTAALLEHAREVVNKAQAHQAATPSADVVPMHDRDALRARFLS